MYLDPVLSQEINGCPVVCTLGEVPSQTVHDTDIIAFDSSNGQLSIATSSSAYAYTSMDFVLTCTSVDSIHMEPLRTVTDTFSVNFISSSSYDCSFDYNGFTLNHIPLAEQQNYQIDGSNMQLAIQPMFFATSTECPVICGLYEGHNADTSQLPQASDPVFRSFDQFTGRLTVSTTDTDYIGVSMPLTIECVATRLYGVGVSWVIDFFWLNFNVPNGCIAQIDPSASFMDD